MSHEMIFHVSPKKTLGKECLGLLCTRHGQGRKTKAAETRQGSLPWSLSLCQNQGLSKSL